MGRRLLRLTGLSDGATVAQRDAALVIFADAISEIQAFSLLHLNALPPLSHSASSRGFAIWGLVLGCVEII